MQGGTLGFGGGPAATIGGLQNCMFGWNCSTEPSVVSGAAQTFGATGKKQGTGNTSVESTTNRKDDIERGGDGFFQRAKREEQTRRRAEMTRQAEQLCAADSGCTGFTVYKKRDGTWAFEIPGE